MPEALPAAFGNRRSFPRLAGRGKIRVGLANPAVVQQFARPTGRKNDDRHVRNKIEGVNRSRGEAAETIHHLYMAHLRGYESKETYSALRERYRECIRMLNGMERHLERQLPESDRRWPTVQEESDGYGSPGFPEPDL